MLVKHHTQRSPCKSSKENVGNSSSLGGQERKGQWKSSFSPIITVLHLLVKPGFFQSKGPVELFLPRNRIRLRPGKTKQVWKNQFFLNWGDSLTRENDKSGYKQESCYLCKCCSGPSPPRRAQPTMPESHFFILSPQKITSPFSSQIHAQYQKDNNVSFTLKVPVQQLSMSLKTSTKQITWHWTAFSRIQVPDERHCYLRSL